ncbi:hypothetical protein ES703_16410 [subsurface metagenome]
MQEIFSGEIFDFLITSLMVFTDAAHQSSGFCSAHPGFGVNSL